MRVCGGRGCGSQVGINPQLTKRSWSKGRRQPLRDTTGELVGAVLSGEDGGERGTGRFTQQFEAAESDHSDHQIVAFRSALQDRAAVIEFPESAKCSGCGDSHAGGVVLQQKSECPSRAVLRGWLDCKFARNHVGFVLP